MIRNWEREGELAGLISHNERMYVQYLLFDKTPPREAAKLAELEEPIKMSAPKNKKVKDYYDFLYQEALSFRHDRYSVTEENIRAELASISFSNIKDYFTTRGEAKKISDIDYRSASAIHTTKNGEIKLHDKVKSLTELAKMLGMYKEDNSQKNVPIVTFEIPDNGRDSEDNIMPDEAFDNELAQEGNEESDFSGDDSDS